MPIESASRTHVGHRRKLNEDALLVSPGGSIWAVADGMGGHEAGEVASAMVIDALSALAPADSLTNHLGKAIGALESVNAALIAFAQSLGEGRTIGSTVVGLVAEGDEFACFWVGDSRALRLRGAEVTQITRDHSLVQDLVDAGMLEAERADDHPNANILTRAVGASDALKVDSVRGRIVAGDTFVLASDGLTRLVRPDEIAQVLAGAASDAAAERLLDMALSRGAPDNVSLVIVRFG